MSEGRDLSLREEDYELIENAVMETSRGRWFLAEYARRNRAADTRLLLDAIRRLERVVSSQTVEFVPSLESSNAVHSARALMRDARQDIAAILAASGSEADRATAKDAPVAALGLRLKQQAATIDELIASLRGTHDALAAGTPDTGARGRLAQAIDRLALLSKSHHALTQAIRRGASLFQALDRSLGGSEGTAPPPRAAAAPEGAPVRKPAAARPADASAPAPRAEIRHDEDGRIVIVRTPPSTKASSPAHADEKREEQPALDLIERQG